jgi:hypothetical protein
MTMTSYASHRFACLEITLCGEKLLSAQNVKGAYCGKGRDIAAGDTQGGASGSCHGRLGGALTMHSGDGRTSQEHRAIPYEV